VALEPAGHCVTAAPVRFTSMLSRAPDTSWSSALEHVEDEPSSPNSNSSGKRNMSAKDEAADAATRAAGATRARRVCSDPRRRESGKF
jgi:hypothetical protein